MSKLFSFIIGLMLINPAHAEFDYTPQNQKKWCKVIHRNDSKARRECIKMQPKQFIKYQQMYELQHGIITNS